MAMKIVNIHAAKTHLSRLVEEAATGEEIVIAKAGKGVARLVPLRGQKEEKRKLGLLAGRLKIPADFDAPLPADLLDAFEGR
jgi:prevent-host-death family protein